MSQDFLVAQWLRLHAATAGIMVRSMVRKLRSHMTHGVAPLPPKFNLSVYFCARHCTQDLAICFTLFINLLVYYFFLSCFLLVSLPGTQYYAQHIVDINNC